MRKFVLALCVGALLSAVAGSALAQDGGWLGVRVQSGAELKVDLSTGERSMVLSGAKVSEVAAGSPAAAVGIKVGDVVLSVDDRQILDGKDVSEIIRMRQPGSVVRVWVKRQDGDRELSVVLGKRPPG